MKRSLALILIALLLFCPLLAARADGGEYITCDVYLFTPEEQATLDRLLGIISDELMPECDILDDYRKPEDLP